MLNYKNKTLDKRVFFLLSASLILITPWHSYDPINLPKFLMLNLLVWPILIHLIYSRKFLFHQRHLILILVSLGFLTWFLISTLFSEVNVVDRLIGNNGKNMGLITYILLTTVLIACSTLENGSHSKILSILVYTGFLSGLYGIFQYSGFDPVNWINTSGLVFSFFGNPNFHSAFTSLSFLSTFTLLISRHKTKYNLLLYISNLLVSLFNLYISGSSQGYVLLLIGLGFFLTYWLHKRSKNTVSSLTILFLPIGAIIIILGDILQKTPWKSLLYEPSISYRGDYWRSGWNMLLANPIFGVGPEGFKDNYRLFRDLKSIQRGISGNVDSSHNIFLDIGTSGGFPLLFLFIGIHILILTSIYRIIFCYKVEDISIIGVISCWIAFQAQSIISVPRISLSILGWILGGLILGYDLNRVRTQQTRQIHIKTKFTVVGLVLGMVIAFPPFINDIRFRTAMTNGEVRVIKQTLNQWPQSYEHFIFTALLLGQAGLSKESLDFSYESIKYNARCFECWESIVQNSSASAEEKLFALKNMQKLEPGNIAFDQFLQNSR